MHRCRLLARLLKEEGRKSMDLAINIIYILYSFSNFSQFHPLLQQAARFLLPLLLLPPPLSQQRIPIPTPGACGR